MSIKSQLLLFMLGLYLNVASADVDCSKRPERVDPKTCCPMPEFITDELKEKCKQYDTAAPALNASGETGSPDDGKRHHHHHHRHHHHNPCFASCIFNETGIYVNDELNEDNLKSYLEVVLKDSLDLQPIVVESFTTCVAKHADFKDKMDKFPHPPLPAGEPMCPHGAGFLMGCVFKKTFKNCPDSVWTDTQECNNMREHFRNCKRSHGPPSPPSAEDI